MPVLFYSLSNKPFYRFKFTEVMQINDQSRSEKVPEVTQVQFLLLLLRLRRIPSSHVVVHGVHRHRLSIIHRGHAHALTGHLHVVRAVAHPHAGHARETGVHPLIHGAAHPHAAAHAGPPSHALRRLPHRLVREARTLGPELLVVGAVGVVPLVGEGALV